MKLEFNKQRIIGIAIVVLFLLVAIPFLLAGNKKADTKSDDKVSLEIPASEAKTDSEINKPAEDLSGTKTSETDSEKNAEVSSESKVSDLPLPETSSAKLSVQTSENSAIEDDIAVPESSADTSATASSATIAGEQQFASAKSESAAQSKQPADQEISDTEKNTTSAVVINNNNAENGTAKKTPKKVSVKTNVHKTAAAKVNVKAKPKSLTANDVKSNNAVNHKTAEAKKWIVRVGYHEKDESAKKIVNALHKKGYKNIYVKNISIKNKEIKNIFVGPMATQKDAEKIEEKLTKILNKKVVVIKMK